mgnify:CR=1 FL=1
MKKVSIIMSTYKTPEKFLNEAINSILNQTYKNIELIIVCDGDIDEYNRINKLYNNKIKLLYNEKNKGLPYSLNLAIKNATGDYIARMDSDDISLNNRIERQVEYLEKNPDVGICGTEAMLFGSKKGIKRIYLKEREQVKIQLLYKATLIHPTIMGRKEVFEEFKYNERFIYAQDFELWSRVSEKYNITILPVIGLKYRVHDKQASIKKKEEQARLSMETIKNNSEKITGKYDDRICQTLYVLGGRKGLTKGNYKEISNNIDYILEKNLKYKDADLKKVLYNRFFELMLKNRIITFNFNVVKKCMRIYNLKDIIEVLKNGK